MIYYIICIWAIKFKLGEKYEKESSFFLEQTDREIQALTFYYKSLQLKVGNNLQ